MTTPDTAATKPNDTFYRSSYAIKRELEPGLKEVTKRLKLSLAELLSMLASDPQTAELLLTAMATEFRVKNASKPRPNAATAAQRKQLQENRNADPATLAKMMAAAGAVVEEQPQE